MARYSFETDPNSLANFKHHCDFGSGNSWQR